MDMQLHMCMSLDMYMQSDMYMSNDMRWWRVWARAGYPKPSWILCYLGGC
jgi:hypothetical protein